MKLGVIDIGTRATRLLTGDTDDLNEYGFRFQDYFNRGTLTEAGRGIYKENGGNFLYKIEYLKNTVNYINYLLELCKDQNIKRDNIYAVGTEVFRRVLNWKEVVSIINGACGIDLKVLDPKEEAESTFWAAIISCREYYDTDEPILVVEQGGGSMQLTVASVNSVGEPTRYGQISIPELGTLLLGEKFLYHQSSSRRVGTVNRDVHQLARDKVNETLKSTFSLSKKHLPLKAFALGSAITNFYNGSNKSIHGKEIIIDQLIADPLENSVLENYKTYQVNSLLKDAENGQITESQKDIKKILEKSYGLPCYAAVMEHFNLKVLRICGTGLRYGIYFRILESGWEKISEYTDNH
jgi:exopolyphosphatase/pppGpp-phosphohydrolase